MKKLVLIMVSAVILTVFIAFNYLLWDRENKIKNFEYINNTKNSSIDTLGAEITNLKNENNQLKARITELEDLNKGAQLKSSELEVSKNKAEKELLQKKEVINILQQQVDMRPLEEPIRKWTESLDKGQLEVAYNLQYDHSLTSTTGMSFNDFSKNYKDSIKSIKLKTLKQVTEGLPENRKGSIAFKATFEVKKVENNTSDTFTDGVNERYFIIDYDKVKKQWVIVDVLASL